MRYSFAVLICMLTIFVVACQPPVTTTPSPSVLPTIVTTTPIEQPTDIPGEPAPLMQARITIVAWLECEECMDGELEAVVELGEVAIPTLLAVLDEGPSPTKLAEAERALGITYQELVTYAETHPDDGIQIDQSQEEFVAFYLDNLRVQYWSRAATALGRIGDADTIGAAMERIQMNAERTEREDLRTVLEMALQELESK